jgi:hypothetical protein
VWLKLLGIDGEPMIAKNSDFERKHLTWRTIQQMLLIPEDDIARSASIVVPEQHTEKTLFLSALLYLVTGRDFAENDGLASNTRFYLAKEDGEQKGQFRYEDLGMNIGPIFTAFNKAKDKIASISKEIREGAIQ